jgi:hypothetical protein
MPIFPAFLKMDISDLPALIGGFSLGPMAAILIQLIKNIFHIIFKNDGTGREQDNVIINWVRSNYVSPGSTTRTGFLKDYRRTNVALSRARKRLILIGDFETLTKSENMKVQYIFSKIKNTETENKLVI